MTGLLDSKLVLTLNASWLPIGTLTVKDAFVAMNSDGKHGESSLVGINFEFEKNENGEWDIENPSVILPTKNWEEWAELPVRPGLDLIVHTPRQSIRVPTVVIAKKYNKVPLRRFAVSRKAILERDQNVCQYTGKKLPPNQLTLDHIVAKSKGGKDTFTNLVACEKELNHKKGNKSLKELGLKLLRQPYEPTPQPFYKTIRDVKHFTWNYFLEKKDKK